MINYNLAMPSALFLKKERKNLIFCQIIPFILKNKNTVWNRSYDCQSKSWGDLKSIIDGHSWAQSDLDGSVYCNKVLLLEWLFLKLDCALFMTKQKNRKLPAMGIGAIVQKVLIYPTASFSHFLCLLPTSLRSLLPSSARNHLRSGSLGSLEVPEHLHSWGESLEQWFGATPIAWSSFLWTKGTYAQHCNKQKWAATGLGLPIGG